MLGLTPTAYSGGVAVAVLLLLLLARAFFVVRVRAELRGALLVLVNKLVNSQRSSFRIWTMFALVFAHLNSFANIAL